MDLDSRDVQRFLGLDRIRRDIRNLLEIPIALNRLEIIMANLREQLDTLSTKVDDLIADVRAALNDGSQEALDALSAKLDAFDAEVGDADGSDAAAPVDAPVDPTEPTA